MEHDRANDPRGEYVLVRAGAPAGEDADAGLTLEQAAQRALELTGCLLYTSMSISSVKCISSRLSFSAEVAVMFSTPGTVRAFCSTSDT